MTDLKTLAKEYLQENFIQESPNGYGFTKIEAIEEVKQITKWINDAYSVLHFINEQRDNITSDEYPYLLEVLIQGVFAEEPNLFSVMHGIRDRWVGDLDEDALHKLSFLNRFNKLYKPSNEQEQAALNHLANRYLEGEESDERILEHCVLMNRPLEYLFEQTGYLSLIQEVA